MSDDDEMAESIRRGGQAWVGQVLLLGASFVSFVASMFTGLLWLVSLAGVFVALAGVATLIARRTIVPAWTWSFVLSFIVDDPLQHQRIMAWIVGVMLILAGLFWAGSTALMFVAS